MGPSTPVNGGGAGGAGASGTAGCCWATAAVLRVGLKLRSAASAIAVKPSFTDISPVLINKPKRPYTSDYQTRQRGAGCGHGEKEIGYAVGSSTITV